MISLQQQAQREAARRGHGFYIATQRASSTRDEYVFTSDRDARTLYRVDADGRITWCAPTRET